MIRLPLPPSAHHKNKQTKREWRKQVEPLIRASLVLPVGEVYEIVVHLYAPWFREGWAIDPKLPDWDRLVTPLQDAIADTLGFNDRQVMHADVWKYASDDEYCMVAIRPMPV